MVIWTQSGRMVVAHWALDPWRNERLALSLREVKKKKKKKKGRDDDKGYGHSFENFIKVLI